MILSKLKEATRTHHELLETTVGVMDRALALPAYERILRKFYGFYAPVECGIEQTLGKQNVIFYQSRLKTPFLAADLRRLNGEHFPLDAVEICNDLPALESFPQTLGCLYVLEGATLGGQVIGRHLRQTLNLTPENGAAFFNSYGERIGPMWKAFGAMAKAQAEILDRDDEIIASAQETFTKFERWMTAKV